MRILLHHSMAALCCHSGSITLDMDTVAMKDLAVSAGGLPRSPITSPGSPRTRLAPLQASPAVRTLAVDIPSAAFSRSAPAIQVHPLQQFLSPLSTAATGSFRPSPTKQLSASLNRMSLADFSQAEGVLVCVFVYACVHVLRAFVDIVMLACV